MSKFRVGSGYVSWIVVDLKKSVKPIDELHRTHSFSNGFFFIITRYVCKINIMGIQSLYLMCNHCKIPNILTLRNMRSIAIMR